MSLRFRRSAESTAVQSTEAAELSKVPLSALALEIKHRGFEMLPVGAWEETVGNLEIRVAELEMRAAGLSETTREFADSGWEAERRAQRNDLEASRLAEMLLDDDC